MEDEVLVKVAAVCCLSVIAVAALAKGVDSALTGTICAIVGGVAGYQIRKACSKAKST